MNRFAIFACGPSMSIHAVEAARVRGLRMIAVNRAYMLAPDAEALVANDLAFWREHPEAMAFAGLKFCCNSFNRAISEIPHLPEIATGTNSGLCALHVAIRRGAKVVYLYGFDMHVNDGLHFFGAYERNTNPNAARMAIFIKQFDTYIKARRIPADVRVINCTPGSALKVFPFDEVQQAVAC